MYHIKNLVELYDKRLRIRRDAYDSKFVRLIPQRSNNFDCAINYVIDNDL